MTKKAKFVWGIIVIPIFIVTASLICQFQSKIQSSIVEATAIQATLIVVRATATTIATQMGTPTATPTPGPTATRTPLPSPTPTPTIAWETIVSVQPTQLMTRTVVEGKWCFWQEQVDYTGTYSASAYIPTPEDSFVRMKDSVVWIEMAHAEVSPIVRVGEAYQTRSCRIGSKIDELLEEARQLSQEKARNAINKENLPGQLEESVKQQLVQLFGWLGFNDVRVSFSDRGSTYTIRLNEMGVRDVDYTRSNLVVNRCDPNQPTNLPELGLQFEQTVRQVQDPNIFSEPTANIMNVAQPFPEDLDFLKADIESTYDVKDGSLTKLHIPMQARGKEGKITTYTLQWIATQFYGIADIKINGVGQTVPYVVQKSVSLEIGTSMVDCQ